VTQWDANWRDETFCELWKTPAPEVVALVATLREHGVARVLDLGCGVGRHTLLFAEAGFAVTATDASPAAIAHCRDWLAARGLEADLRIADMGEIPGGPEHFDAILAYNVIYHARRAELARIVGEIAAGLRPGGLFYGTFIDKENPKYGLGREIEPDTFVMDEGAEAGVPHHYVDESSLRELLQGFELLELGHIQQVTHLHPEVPQSSKLAALARKPIG
jgi:SAM-dependent methyltransferase